MTKGRTPGVMPAGTEIAVREDVLAADAQALTEISLGQQMVMDASNALEAVGAMKMGVFMATVAEKAIAQTYITIKESKAYKGLPYQKDGMLRQVATLEEFCDVFMPKSRRRCEELAANFHLLGPALYEQAEAIGFRQRDYNALKALPADDQAIVKQAIEVGKFDNAIELMQDMAVRHAQEKSALTKEAAEAKANYQALDKVERQTRERLSDMERKQALSSPWDQQLLGATEELNQIGTVADEVLGKHVAYIDLLEKLADQDGHEDKLEQVRVPISRLGDQLARFGHVVARLQYEFETRLSMYQDTTHVLPAAEE